MKALSVEDNVSGVHPQLEETDNVMGRANILPVDLALINKKKSLFIEEVMSSSVYAAGSKWSLKVRKEIEGKLERKKALIPIVFAEDIFSLLNNFEKTLEKLPQFVLPMHEEISCGFEIVQPNMWPTIGLNSIVLTNECILEELEGDKIYIIYIAEKGLYCCRFSKRIKNKLIFKNDNLSYQDYEFDKECVTKLYKVNLIITRI